MEEDAKNESGVSLVNSKANVNPMSDKLKQKQDKNPDEEENDEPEAPADQDENQDRGGRGQGQFAGPTQSQVQYQQNMKGFNPCKCCCGGNLRQACFAIAILEIVFFCWFIISILFTSLQWKADEGMSEKKNSTALNLGKPVSSTYYLANIVVYSLLGITLVGAITTMLIATIHRSKLCCLLHSAFAAILGIFYFSIFIVAIVQLVELHSDGDGCSAGTDGKLTSPKCQDGLFGPVGLVRLILRALFAALFIYMSVISLGLYLKYRKGILYENTPLNNCKAYCSCCKKDKNQGNLDPILNANGNNNVGQSQSQFGLSQNQSQIQSQSRIQSQNQSQVQIPKKKKKNKNVNLAEEKPNPPPEYNVNVNSTSSLNPEPPANSK